MTWLRGVNLPSYSFGAPPFPGVHGTNYLMPYVTDLDYFAGKGMNTVVLPFQWEEAQRTVVGPLDEVYMGRIDAYARECIARGLTLILSPHNFAVYTVGKTEMAIGSTNLPVSAFSDFWYRMTLRYKASKNVLFDLMCEPKGSPTIPSAMWSRAATSAIKAIRDGGYDRDIFCCGNGYSGAASWANNWYGTPNSVEMLNVVDPLDKTIFNIHCYVDSDGSGTYASGDVTSPSGGVDALKGVTAWAKQNKKKLWLGEFGMPNTTNSKLCATGMLNYLNDNADVWTGWAWWAGGPWMPNYPLSLEPENGKDKPQIAWLAPFLTSTPAPTPTPPVSDMQKIANYVNARNNDTIVGILRGDWK